MDLGIPLEKLENDPAIIFALDRNLRLIFCNASWARFARENDGEAWLAEHALGKNIMDVVAQPLQPFYQRAYASARETAEPWEHQYECSSPEKYRAFQMRILPLPTTRGFLIVNSLAVEREHGTGLLEHLPAAATYESEAGLITMCSHCRRTVRVDGSKTWDWVPEHLRLRGKVSHGLCIPCYSYFYPDLHGPTHGVSS